jgi:uncharacterized protein
MATGPLAIQVARLRRRKGVRLRVEASAALDPAYFSTSSVADSRVPEGAEARCDLVLEAYDGGVRVTGRVLAPWRGMCRRCTVAVGGILEVAIEERYCDPPARGAPFDEEAFLITDDVVDLRPLVDEAILAELPLAPLCREDCLGLCPTCGADRNEEPCACVAPRDPRWDSLDVLRTSF